MQNLVLYSKWSCPLPATLFTLVSAIGGSAVVSHYKNHLIVFPIIPSCSEQPVYSVHRGCECVCTVAAKWSLHLPPTFSLSLTLLRCLSLLSPHYKATSPPSNPFLLYISLSPFSFVLFIPSPSTHLSPSFFSPPLPPPLLFTFLWLIIQQLEATSQPYVSENCHLTLLACIISSLLSAFNFARNLWLFLFFLTVKLINRAARSQFPAVWIYLTILAGFKLVFVWKSFLYYPFFSFSV